MLFDYTAVTADSIVAVTDEALAKGEDLIESVISVEGSRTFENTVMPLDRIGFLLSSSDARGAFLANCSTDKAIRDVAREQEERQTKWAADLAFRRDLYEAIHEYADTDEAAALDGEQRRLLDFAIRDFRMAGQELTPDVRADVQSMRQRLVELGVGFSRNLAEYEDALVIGKDDLDGLPDDYVARLTPGDEEGTYKVTMTYPDVFPFMDNARRRDLREQLSLKFNNRAVAENRPLLEEALDLRKKIADAFGVPSWAHYRMQEKMAKTPDAVREMYDGLLPPMRDKVKAEVDAMADLLEQDEGTRDFRSHDWRYYETQQRLRDYGIDQSEVAGYFPIESVLQGMLDLTQEVFGLEYVRVDDHKAWHEDVVVYEVHDAATGELWAHFYMDLYPREGKYTHAAAWPLVPSHRREDGSYQTAVAAVLANFTKPTADQPSLLQHDEVVTLFHEFGHVLHMCLSRAELTRFSGASTEWDFVEAPSQIMEHWCWNADVLARFARHHETGEPIPKELVEQLVAARNLNIGLFNLRQAQIGHLDQWFHDGREERDLDAINREAQAISTLPFQEGTFMPASFEHILGGAYDAGYYGYMWAQVFGDDMFSRFESEGVTSANVGMEYRQKILEPNGTKDAMDMLVDFLGREPNQDAYLRYQGIVAA